MSEHSKEPWEIYCPEPYDMIIHSENHRVCKVWLDDSPLTDFNTLQCANARRIVACVNACAGVSTEALEKQGGNAIHAMAQRDELLEALKELEKRAGYMAHQCGYFQDEVPELLAARTVIAKTEAPHATEIRS